MYSQSMSAKVPEHQQQTPTLRPQAIKLQQVEEANPQRKSVGTNVTEYQQKKLELLKKGHDDTQQIIMSGNKKTDDLLSMIKKSKAYVIALAFAQLAQLVGIGFQVALYFKDEQLAADGEA